jgi:hypothetical protein
VLLVKIKYTDIARAVAVYLLLPKVNVAFGQMVHLTILVSVPKATVDKNHQTIFLDGNIGTAGQILVANTKPVSGGIQGSPDNEFRFCVATMDLRHHKRTFGL